MPCHSTPIIPIHIVLGAPKCKLAIREFRSPVYSPIEHADRGTDGSCWPMDYTGAVVYGARLVAAVIEVDCSFAHILRGWGASLEVRRGMGRFDEDRGIYMCFGLFGGLVRLVLYPLVTGLGGGSYVAELELRVTTAVTHRAITGSSKHT